MFRPVVAIIRSLSFDTLKSTLYNCVLTCLMTRSQHQDLIIKHANTQLYKVLFLSVSNDKDLMMATTGRNM